MCVGYLSERVSGWARGGASRKRRRNSSKKLEACRLIAWVCRWVSEWVRLHFRLDLEALLWGHRHKRQRRISSKPTNPTNQPSNQSNQRQSDSSWKRGTAGCSEKTNSVSCSGGIAKESRCRRRCSWWPNYRCPSPAPGAKVKFGLWVYIFESAPWPRELVLSLFRPDCVRWSEAWLSLRAPPGASGRDRGRRRRRRAERIFNWTKVRRTKRLLIHGIQLYFLIANVVRKFFEVWSILCDGTLSLSSFNYFKESCFKKIYRFFDAIDTHSTRNMNLIFSIPPPFSMEIFFFWGGDPFSVASFEVEVAEKVFGPNPIGEKC